MAASEAGQGYPALARGKDGYKKSPTSMLKDTAVVEREIFSVHQPLSG